MSAQQHSWERPLLAWAAEGLDYDPPVQAPMRDARLLDQAYAYCDKIAREQGRTFYKASGLLPDEKRRAVRALTPSAGSPTTSSTGRVTEPEAALAAWKQRSLVRRRRGTSPDDPVVVAWADAGSLSYPDGIRRAVDRWGAHDLTTTRYASFDDLAAYCYGVASTVGLLSMHIIGFAGREAIPYAVKLGVALQLTNIFRDVREDWAAGRVYLPQEELAAFGLSDADISALSTTGFHGEDGVTDRWRAFMRFQIERNRQLYVEAAPGIAWLDPAGRFAIAAAAGLYRDILESIAARDGDVFSQRAKPQTRTALPRAIGLWCRSQRPPGSKGGGRVEQRCPSHRSRRYRTRLSDGWYVARSSFRKSRSGLRSTVFALYFTGLAEAVRRISCGS